MNARPDKVANAEQQKRRPPQAEALINAVLEAGVVLYRSPDGTGYVDIPMERHVETWPIRSRSFKRYVRHRYYKKTGGAPNAEMLETAIGSLEARAQFDGGERPVHLRVAEHNGRIYVDLCDPEWRVVEIGRAGWRVITQAPVRFRRTAGMRPLPEPAKGGRLDELRSHLHLSDGGYVLAVSWLLTALRGRGPYPVLALNGEQGAGKSTAAAMLRRLVDPNTAPLRAMPRDNRDLFIAANNAHAIVLDNLSGIPAEMSDSLCRLATGGGFSTRTLHTDTDETLFSGQRPIILTSIDDVATRSDLADRSLIVGVEAIPENKRCTEDSLWAAFDNAAPEMFGALLGAVSKGLKHLPTTRLARLPRMADYALWVAACEKGMWAEGTHLKAYRQNRSEAVEIVLDADPVAGALRQYMAFRDDIVIDTTELLNTLTGLVSEQVRRSPSWPLTPRGLTGRFKRLAAPLRAAGLVIEKAVQHPVLRRAQVRILRTTGADNPSHPSNASKLNEFNGGAPKGSKGLEGLRSFDPANPSELKPLKKGKNEASEGCEGSSPYNRGMADDGGCSDFDEPSDAEQEALLQ